MSDFMGIKANNFLFLKCGAEEWIPAKKSFI